MIAPPKLNPETLHNILDQCDEGQEFSELLVALSNKIQDANNDQWNQMLRKQEPYGVVTVVHNPGCAKQHWFYRWPEPAYLDNAKEIRYVYLNPTPTHLDSLQEQIKQLEYENAALKRQQAADHAYTTKDVWFWQGDGEDHPESMCNSLHVVIRADELRKIIDRNPKWIEP